MEVTASFIAPFNVVESCKVVIDKPPTGYFTFLNITKSFTERSP